MAGQKVSTFRERFSELISADPRSRSSIASELGVAKQTISAWITGQTSPRFPMCSVIANYFGVSVSWLLGFDVPKYVSDNNLLPDEDRLLAGYRSLSPRGKDLLHDRCEELKLLYGKKSEDSTAESV